MGNVREVPETDRRVPMSSNPQDPAGGELDGGPDAAPPGSETIRQAYRREESLVRGTGRLQLLFSVYATGVSLFAIARTLDAYLLVSAPGAKFTADWVYDLWRMGWMAALAAYGLAGMAAGYGLWRLRGWAPRVEMATLLVALTVVLLTWVLVAVGDENAHWQTGALVMPAIATPGLVFAYASTYPAVRDVLSAEYAEAIARTADVKVKPRLPWRLKLAITAFLLLLVAAAVMAEGNFPEH
jgi:hypothetical protein